MHSTSVLPICLRKWLFKGYLYCRRAPVLLTGAPWKAHKTDGPLLGRDSPPRAPTFSVTPAIEQEDQCDRAPAQPPGYVSVAEEAGRGLLITPSPQVPSNLEHERTSREEGEGSFLSHLHTRGLGRLDVSSAQGC